jgi:hypothetical protein
MARKPNFKFTEMDWREGDLICIPAFKKFCTVAGPRTVKFGRREMSITAVFSQLHGKPNISKELAINTRRVESLREAYVRTYHAA